MKEQVDKNRQEKKSEGIKKINLIEDVAALSLEEDLLLQLIAVIYEPVSANFLTQSLSSLAIAPYRDQKPNLEDIEAILLELRHRGILNNRNQCPPGVAEQMTRRALTRKRFKKMATMIEKAAPVDYTNGKWTTRCWRALRQFRLGVYTQDFDKLDEALTFFESEGRHHLKIEPPPVLMMHRGFNRKWLGRQPVSLQFFLLDYTIRYALDRLRLYPRVIGYLEDNEGLTIPKGERVPFHRLLASTYLLQGRFEDLEQLIGSHTESFLGSGFSGSLAFLRGETEQALQLFAEDLEQLKEYTGTKDCFFLGITGLFCVFALMTRDQEGDRDRVRQAIHLVLSRCTRCPEEIPFRFLDALLRSSSGILPDMKALTDDMVKDERSLSYLVALLALHWMGVEIPEDFQVTLEKLYKRAVKSGYLWFAMEAAQLLGTLDKDKDDRKAEALALSEQIGCRYLTHIIIPQSSWKQSLQDLIDVTRKIREPERTTRLCWQVDYKDGQLELVPKEQKKSSAGKWTKGRSIALNRLVPSEEVDYLTAQDREICDALFQIDESSSKNGGYVFDRDKALPALIGHPLVFLKHAPQTPVEIVAGEPELVVERKEDNLFIHFAQDIGEGLVAVWPETPTRYKVIQITDEHRKVAEITGRQGLHVPMAASQQVLDAINNIASFMTVHSAIEVPEEKLPAQYVESDPTVHIHIIPYGSGFRIELFVRPFKKGGPYLKPGAGVANLIAEIEGSRLRTRRDLKLEEMKAREIEESCPMLDLAIDFEQENSREWHLLDPEECLQVLIEIEEIREQVVLEWPEGEKLAVRRQAGINQLNLNIRTSQQDWFSLTGQLEIDQDEVMELKTLLDKVKESRSRFIPMGDGQFLALTQEFRNRLEELILYGSTHPESEDEVKVHPLAAMALDELTHQAKTNADDGWRERLRSIEDAQNFVPKVPSTLKAELREYQNDGFVWMSRLAHMGVGACLADDMGLGKTLQAITVVLGLAHQGPTLVVAPTSVCMNWETEVHRFAPTLNFHMFSELNRDEIIHNLGKFDLLVTSYTLLQQEIELLSQVEWQSVVLDEAQAIKNAATKRSKAAMQINARFRLITTGTPIENHLGELWNLFAFINPGLLGTYKQFNRRFGIPIEKYHDREARRTLKKLIRPFMLRRIKSQVLEELPPRTEITLRVEMKPEELQFYEALRQQAIENIEGSSEKAGRHLRILAEIMRLRRACCHPKLINEQVEIPSTKLQVFSEVVDELLGGGHKALVFSQFTGHLALIRNHLEEKGISYKYLDGTTPAKDRQQQVESFQAGDGELFLISLKAGGLGLNLTAADYVIHMDPWWNPAVEDQAADRAHRIGQKRPVTVYRLVTADTIEEKIVKLHQEKRDLANSLLEGSDVSTRISAEELLELIRSA